MVAICRCCESHQRIEEHGSSTAKLDSLVRENVLAQLANLQTHPSVAVGLANRTLNLHGWVFDIENGTMSAYDKISKSFLPIIDNADAKAT